MEHKNPTSVKLIYWITQVVFWLFTAAGFFAIFIAIALIFNLIHDLKLDVGIPVRMDVVEVGAFEFGDQSTTVQLNEMIGKLRFDSTPLLIQRVYGVFILVILSITYYLLMTFRVFITQVYKGHYFERKNILLLKRISYGLLAIWIITVFYGYFQYFFIVNNMKFESIVSNGNVETYPVILLFALFIWVLSHIFMKGVEMESERELTI